MLTNVKSPEDPDTTLLGASTSSDNERTLTDAQNETENDGQIEENSEIIDEVEVPSGNNEAAENEGNREKKSEIIGEIHIATEKKEEAEKNELKEPHEEKKRNEERLTMSRISRRLRNWQKDEKQHDDKKTDVNGAKSEIIDDMSKAVPKVSETCDNKRKKWWTEVK